jgi:RecJ-like exonuclease
VVILEKEGEWMQNDLISRSALIEYINSKEFQRRFIQSKETIQDILRTFINEQPPAYNVEKVVEDVKEENKRALKEMYKIHGNQYTTILLKKHNDKIDDIVRNGGKE